MLVRTSVFQAVGGFTRIRGEMLDDVALAKLIKHNGYRTGFHAAPELLQVRLYKGNSHAFWGMTKNVLQGMGGRVWMAPAVMLLTDLRILDSPRLHRRRRSGRHPAPRSRGPG